MCPPTPVADGVAACSCRSGIDLVQVLRQLFRLVLRKVHDVGLMTHKARSITLVSHVRRDKMSPMRQAAIVVLAVAAVIALATVHLSRGEPLRATINVVTVRPDAR